MLDPKELQKNLDHYQAQLQKKGYQLNKEELLTLFADKKDIQQKIEYLQNQKNILSKNKDLSPEEKNLSLTIGMEIKARQGLFNELEEKLHNIMLNIPNLPSERTPEGKSEDDNVIIGEHGKKPSFSFTPKEHDKLLTDMKLLDFERAAKISSSRFSIFYGPLTLLEKALEMFLLENAVENGYTPISVPFLVNRETATGTGQLPKFEDEMFKVKHGERDLFLIPTAEVPVTNIYAGEILALKDLTKSFCSLSPCFRSEAGSAGRDVRGLIRQHQFTKLELVKFVHPDQSWQEFDKLLLDAESALKKLNLHYVKKSLCTADSSFSAAYTCDIEVWMPGQGKYREISSCSNFGDFQARRAKIKVKDEKGNNIFVHTLNGSALPVGRLLVAITENYQNEDGSISIPEALKKYFNYTKIDKDGKLV